MSLSALGEVSGHEKIIWFISWVGTGLSCNNILSVKAVVKIVMVCT